MLNRYLSRSITFLASLGTTVYFLWKPLQYIFFHNPILNSLILGLIGLGIILSFYQFHQLSSEITWLECLEKGNETTPTKTPNLLKPLQLLFDQFSNKSFLPTKALQSTLQSIALRFDDLRGFNRYLTGLLVFLGLLGTFWGLSKTIISVADVIRHMTPTPNADVLTVFETLKEGLQSPLSGMGTAFSSSLFGITGSLVLGFLDLQVNKASQTLLFDLENKLTPLTIVTNGGHSDSYGKAYTNSLLGQTVEAISQLHTIVQRQEESRLVTVKQVDQLQESIQALVQQGHQNQVILKELIQTQSEHLKNLNNLLALLKTSSHAIDTVIGKGIGNIDTTMSKVLVEMMKNREQFIEELRKEIRLVARTISSIASDSAA